jgi:5-methylcytosine-specific restriction endonuclease McrA
MRTLVLNAGYEPLAVVTFRRAIVLVLHGKATVVAEDPEVVTGVSCRFPRPSVIVLNRYVKRPYRSSIPVTRRGVLRRDGHRCAYCGKSATTIDHVHPRSRGGRDTWENLVACCLACNNRKGDKTLSQIGWELSFQPREPHGASWHIKELEKATDAWNDFLAPAA